MPSLLKIHLAVFLFGMAGLFGRFLHLPAIIIVFGRVFFASLFLSVLLGYNRQRFVMNLKSDKYIVFLSGLLLSFHWIAFFRSIQLSTVAIGLLTFSTFPVFTIFLEPVFFRKSIDKKDLFLAFIALCGVYLILPNPDFSDKIFVGAIWGIFSGLSFSFLSLINKKLVNRNSTLQIAFWQDIVACLVLLLPSAHYLLQLRWSEIAWLFLLGTLFTAVAHSLFIDGMKVVPAGKSSIIAALEPVYGILFASLLFAEFPGFKVITGGILILSSAVLAGKMKNPELLRD